MKKHVKRGTTLDEFLAEEMKDPEFRQYYEDAKIEMKVALAITKARESRGADRHSLRRTWSRLVCDNAP